MKKVISLFILLMLVIGCVGCGGKEQPNNECKDLEFEVLTREEIPQKVLEKIHEKKEKPYQFSYRNKKDFYIVVGYGAKPTGGYCIKVESLQQCGDKIVIKTELIEPSKEDVVADVVSYQFIVVKTKDLDMDVQYQTN